MANNSASATEYGGLRIFLYVIVVFTIFALIILPTSMELYDQHTASYTEGYEKGYSQHNVNTYNQIFHYYGYFNVGGLPNNNDELFAYGYQNGYLHWQTEQYNAMKTNFTKTLVNQ
jgi:hypothetical protein